MLIYVWKKNEDTYLKTAVIDYATSVIWVSRYRECGEFEIYIPGSKELVTLFQGDIIFTRDDSETVMILEKFKLTSDEEQGDFLILSGRSLESIFERRVVSRQTELDGTLADGVFTLLDKFCMNPVNAEWEKRIDGLRFGSSYMFGDHMEKQITGDTLLTVFTDICTVYDCGFKLVCDDTPNTFEFRLYRGRDITDTVIFSPQFGNLAKSEFTFDYSQYFNYIYTAGEGEGKDRVIIGYESDDIEYSTLKGLNRREYWLDERNCSSNSDHPQSDTFYFAALQSKGREKCKELRPVVQYTGEVVDNGMYKYHVDYELGDTVLIENEYGIQAKATIIEVTEVEDESGYKIVPTLSEWVTLKDYFAPVIIEECR